ncbi:hypothetical protein GCM10010840_33500 [Deinococcus aerolatus]|uniref:Uncharacterized protein n=1 Tax=Deinococcus aerolatus TaxID=522487 RepID=A0ABQ2GER0_9DEIO|nr:hypothetical protein GCM10010840_33500 [Deinococcus aerolatus]
MAGYPLRHLELGPKPDNNDRIGSQHSTLPRGLQQHSVPSAPHFNTHTERHFGTLMMHLTGRLNVPRHVRVSQSGQHRPQRLREHPEVMVARQFAPVRAPF